MSIDNLALERISSLTTALERLPQGRQAYELAIRLGLATPGYATPEERAPFPRKFSDMPPDELSDLLSEWSSEMGRLVEWLGTIGAQLQLSKTQEKAARARARSRARSTWPDDQRKPTKGELDDKAEEDVEVIELIERIAYLELLHAQTKATLDATKLYMDAVNKEIILRTAQMKAGVY